MEAGAAAPGPKSTFTELTTKLSKDWKPIKIAGIMTLCPVKQSISSPHLPDVKTVFGSERRHTHTHTHTNVKSVCEILPREKEFNGLVVGYL